MVRMDQLPTVIPLVSTLIESTTPTDLFSPSACLGMHWRKCYLQTQIKKVAYATFFIKRVFRCVLLIVELIEKRTKGL